jgi:hypothetical protein
MSNISVNDSPLHNRVDLNLIANTQQSWHSVLTELRDGGEHGVNNNQLKERARIFKAHVEALCLTIEALPPQGRTLEFSGSSNMFTPDSFNNIIHTPRNTKFPT